jgi:uncharacterized spore protein YtfJ
MSFSDDVKTVISEMQNALSVKTAIGEPIDIDDKILIPIVKVGMGFGVGSGRSKGQEGQGGGAGGGGTVTPVAFISIFKGVKGPEGVKILPVKEVGGLSKIVESMPEVMQKVMKMQKSGKGTEEESGESE